MALTFMLCVCVCVVCVTLACSNNPVSEQLEMLEMSELLWSLCEILLIDIVPGLFRPNTMHISFKHTDWSVGLY